MSPPAVEIRRATHTDVDAVVALFVAAHRLGAAVLPPLASEVETQASIAAEVASAEVWVADAEGQVVGMLVLAEHHIAHLYVAPTHQHQGIGGRLVDQAKLLSPTRLDLITAERNLAARRFYEGHGFFAIGRTGEPTRADLRYEWWPARHA
ncbi:MAG: GNAT family N-acetyltransferase [Chloroflexi bacterium]|nr:GNAT family N-acetyltransferase [Chloroflexota bacterium]